MFSKYPWIVSLKEKQGIIITKYFQNILDKSSRKPNKIWLDKGSKFYNRPMKSWFHDNDTEMSSTHNEGKSVVSGRFIRTLKNKIYKNMTSISKEMYIGILNDVVKECSNAYHSKMRPVEVKSSTYIDWQHVGVLIRVFKLHSCKSLFECKVSISIFKSPIIRLFSYLLAKSFKTLTRSLINSM